MTIDFDYIKATTDASKLAYLYRLELKQSGRNYKCLCPFHNDSEPSMILTDNYKGSGFTRWHCFVCGEGGDVIDFAKRMDGNVERLLPIGQQMQQYEPKERKPKEKPPICWLDPKYILLRLEPSEVTASAFKRFLSLRFDIDAINRTFSSYRVGVSDGATIFWQIDINGVCRSGKIMKYNEATGKRIKEGKDLIDWVHSRLKKVGMIPDSWQLTQCLFGEHLLKGNVKPIAIVESEKTAIIASLWNPSVLWLATGGKANYTERVLQVLRGVPCLVFPDGDAMELWQKKSEELNRKGFRLQVSRITMEGKQDLADVILQRFPIRYCFEGVDECPF